MSEAEISKYSNDEWMELTSQNQEQLEYRKKLRETFKKEFPDGIPKEEWIEANKHIHKYKNNIIKFLENENLE